MKRWMVSLFLIFSMSMIMLSGCVQKADTDISGKETGGTSASLETQFSTAGKETQEETTASSPESAAILETTLVTEPSMSSPEADFMTRLNAGEIIAWKSGDSLELDYEAEGKEVVEYSTTYNESDDTTTYTLTVNGLIMSKEEFDIDDVCYLAKVSGNIVFLVGVCNRGSDYWTDIYTYAYGELIYLGNIFYTAPAGNYANLWIDSSGALNNQHTSGMFGIADYAQRHIVAFSNYHGSSDALSLVEVPAGLTPMGYYVTAQASVNIYSNRYGDSMEWTINPGEEVIFVATDVLEYVYVEKADHSQKGWIRIDYYENTCQVSDGTMKNIYDVFTGLPRGG